MDQNAGPAMLVREAIMLVEAKTGAFRYVLQSSCSDELTRERAREPDR